MANTIRETELYAPIKTYLQGQGYEVKGEVGAADLVAVRDGEDPVIVELKTAVSLTLFHQGIARQTVTDWVYLAVPRSATKAFAKTLKSNIALARRLGLGLITVRLRDGHVEVHCDPGPYQPRQSKPRKARLLREFARRVGDPNTGGATRAGLITAYRQDALRCAAHLAEHGPTKGAEVAKATGVPTATRLMAADHYGWFERVQTGIYAVTPKGVEGLKMYATALQPDK
ncbi:hypothetical protein ACMU_13830 [Actibacterium mucosum KCTC 23349]|uniref:Uncharacterized protein n=1 Tax=Actibacterium mucosum KCTC 23349 TaxID=1454373 RepID=A0A037ZEC8_9RHOB|nr:DUF2161 family putative PD-(D/E)XK-type phosphodiesterase [Actibacterium mucosum]KAJ54840.1 hypothetical protein ACMU_13830 [Actibacterium mucosum KCTC 23349]